jgi:hypothetical protein
MGAFLQEGIDVLVMVNALRATASTPTSSQPDRPSSPSSHGGTLTSLQPAATCADWSCSQGVLEPKGGLG